MPHDIIDNRELHLADAVRPLLSESVHAHFAVGYFFLSGFKAIADQLATVQELRLLIGNTSDRATIEQLAEGHASREAIIAHQREGEFLNAQQRAKLVAEGERRIRERLERLDQTDEDQALISELVYAIYEGDGKRLEAIEDDIEKQVDLEVQEAEDLLRRIKRQQPELFARITSLPNAIRTAKQPTADAAAPKRPVIFFFGQAGDFQRLWLADAESNILAEDNHSSIAAITCPPTEKRQPLPAHYNVLVTTLKAKFDQQYQDYLAAGGTPHRLTATQRWALDMIRDAYKQTTELLTQTPETKDMLARLERLRNLWSVSPLDGRVEFALRGLRNQKPALDEAITLLESLAFEHKLEALAQRQTEVNKLVSEPAIICSEALL